MSETRKEEPVEKAEDLNNLTVESLPVEARREIDQMLSPRLPDAEQEFLQRAEDSGVYHALDWDAESVREAQAFDNFTSNTRQAFSAWKDGEQELSEVLYFIEQDISAARSRVMHGEHHEPHNLKMAYAKGVGSAYKTLRDVASILEADLPVQDLWGRFFEMGGGE